MRSWARVLTLGSPYTWRTSLTRGGIGGRRRALLLMGELFAGEVLTHCSRTRIVERNCKRSIHVGCAVIGVCMPKSKVHAKRRKSLKDRECAYRGQGVWACSVPRRGNANYVMQLAIVSDTLGEEMGRYYGRFGVPADTCAGFSVILGTIVGILFPVGSFFDEESLRALCVSAFESASGSLHLDVPAVPRKVVNRVLERIVERCADTGVPVV